MTVGDRLRRLRGQKTLQEFAEPLEIGSANISHIENGRSKLSTDLAIRIATVYQISIDWLLMGVGTMNIEDKVKPPPPNNDYVTISKDELLELRRIALDKTLEEKRQAEEQVARLKNDK
ncbi:helix-turn-helix domain-containing protein [Arundinibacter roseus]|uniref:Helix-turn-helix domain-containing protein n=1 Tax=Arundinibacter roseus TaxID=2070510 RepID=A0A4R4KGF7_9BACT|nr:helix-turn-helix transcriptional regulator [Arundinibacter roseus]TDB67088.1 helix-turn-helix domain-containing protein [Arundinibacter roseus]